MLCDRCYLMPMFCYSFVCIACPYSAVDPILKAVLSLLSGESGGRGGGGREGAADPDPT